MTDKKVCKKEVEGMENEGMIDLWGDEFGFTPEDYTLLRELKMARKAKMERKAFQGTLDNWM